MSATSPTLTTKLPAAAANNEPISELAERFSAAYVDDMTTPGVRPPDIVPKATHHIDEIIAMIEQLIAQQHAYVSADHVLFRAFRPALRQSVEAQLGRYDRRRPGGRCGYKRDAKDFVL